MESKFISNESIASVQAQVGLATSQRLDALELNLQNTVQFLHDYETFIDSQVQELTQQQNRLEETVMAACRIDSERLTLIQKDHEEKNTLLRKAAGRALLIALGAVILTIGMGVTLWLVK